MLLISVQVQVQVQEQGKQDREIDCLEMLDCRRQDRAKSMSVFVCPKLILIAVCRSAKIYQQQSRAEQKQKQKQRQAKKRKSCTVPEMTD